MALRKLEDEYALCIADYDSVLAVLGQAIQAVQAVEQEIQVEQQTHSSTKAVIFDYERLKRVLLEQRNYLRDSSTNDRKAHESRIGELTSMRARLVAQNADKESAGRAVRFKAGLLAVVGLFRKKTQTYGRQLLNEARSGLLGSLAIRTLRNCLDLGTIKHRATRRSLFRLWHHRVYPKALLATLT